MKNFNQFVNDADFLYIYEADFLHIYEADFLCIYEADFLCIYEAFFREFRVESEIFPLFQMEELRSSVAMYLSDISNVLNRVPRQLLLILKTNDLLRGIDHQLQTSEASRSFVTMSKCCAKAVAREELKSCATWSDRLMVYGRWSLDNARIALYQLSVQDFFISPDVLASFATNFVSRLLIAMLFGVS